MNIKWISYMFSDTKYSMMTKWKHALESFRYFPNSSFHICSRSVKLNWYSENQFLSNPIIHILFIIQCWFHLMLGVIIIKDVERFEAGPHQPYDSIHSLVYPYKSFSFCVWCRHRCSSWKRAYMDYELSLAFSRYRVSCAFYQKWLPSGHSYIHYF